MTELKSPTTVKENRALPLTTKFTLRWAEHALSVLRRIKRARRLLNIKAESKPVRNVLGSFSPKNGPFKFFVILFS